jgi:NAD(P)-dependent dehydrogenase (short-subunit alcohol dehydrogenase family)
VVAVTASDQRRLAGRSALVTGASSGIGAATARLLAREGADVALLARGEGLTRVARQVRSEGSRAIELRADVADREALEAAVATAEERLGGLDVVVVGAAAAAYGRFEEIPAADFDRCVDVTFRGAVDTVRATLPALERSGGRLVVIGSSVDAIPIAFVSPYVAAKHALDGFLASLRAELRRSGSAVSISAIRPGPVDSPFWRHLAEPGGPPGRRPPIATYSTESVARAVVACAIEPRASVTVGAATLVLQVASLVARPLVERVLGFGMADWIGRAGGDRRAAGGNLWEPMSDGEVEGQIGGRPSLLAALRLGGSRPGRL